ncbi:MAG: hypothetical protein NTW03_03965 [Verrucomicrobia bacterium]|nr:hypothetical protein [Verrucomicrobiota bacterium]
MNKTNSPGRSSRHSRWALTLPEVMISLTLFGLILVGLVSGQLYGLRMLTITTPKLGASDEARAAVSKLIEDIRSAKLIRIGTGTSNSFTELGVDQPHIGNSIQVYPTLDTNVFVRYFWDGTDQKLKRTANGAAAVLVLANSVSNSLVFTAEDYAGNILTNNHNNRVIGLKLEFYQIQYPKMSVGPGQYYDYYQLHTKITRRTIM